MRYLQATVSVLACIFTTIYSGDEFHFASYYGDHMVLQKAPAQAVLWGYGTSGADVVVWLSGGLSIGLPHKQTHSVKVVSGIWRVTLLPMEAGGPYNITAIQISVNTPNITLTDVLFGDIWLCGGQSNMAFTLAQVFNASEELALASKYPNVRIFQAALEQSAVELQDLAGVEVPWSLPSAENLGGGSFTHFSAVCWLFGRYLYETLKYPVGLVESCWGGTPAEAWSSPRVLKTCGVSGSMDSYTMPLSSKKWESTVLWNAMIHPLLNMTIKGAIWYQGEANTNYNQDKYSCVFPAMIDDWRMAFHEASGGQTAADFPFGFVQLCTYRQGRISDGFPEIRWHQTADYGFAPNERMKNTFMAVAMDLPDNSSPYGSIHPRDKQDVAHRLVLGARAVVYGERNVAFQGPFPVAVIVIGSTLQITYNQKVAVTLSKDSFEICCSSDTHCGPQSTWLPAPMWLSGADSILVNIANCTIDKVAALRYAWSDWVCGFKACPVYSADQSLPAPPFIINRWPQ